MYRFNNIALLVLIQLSFGLCTLSGWGKETIWLRGSFAEIGSASPVIGHATFTLDLARKVIAATPKEFLEEAKQSGFDIPAIFQAIEAMPVSETFQIQQEDMKLEIEKYRVEEEETGSRLLLIKMNSPKESLNLPIPLSLTSTAIPLLQLAVKELAGLEKALGEMLEEVKRTKPGVVIVGEDKLMNSTLEIKLQ